MMLEIEAKGTQLVGLDTPGHIGSALLQTTPLGPAAGPGPVGQLDGEGVALPLQALLELERQPNYYELFNYIRPGWEGAYGCAR
ncbi:hypothetical protein VQ02_07350 [Methylobacterium variabile]|uniref:Uncharacterized protein n=1 Tax=Methylobacterium variabile TaxID=298794 RepID=A0A0J6T502_9HYPH|nr:hypothetical protein [Methylobacterium variabile]KMO40648.1 hypothetical protein VQ02_07350 [Methylobacterium variabile]